MTTASGQRLLLVEAVGWDRSGGSSDLTSVLRELMAVDPGRGVDLVLGYVSTVRMPTSVTEAYGMANLGGRHVVLRAMTLAIEYDEMERGLDLLPAEELNELARERRVHREVTILLHEWAHTLGAQHEESNVSIMSAAYGPRAVGFSPESVRLIEAVLRSVAQRTEIAAAPPPAMTPAPPSARPPGPSKAGQAPASQGTLAELPDSLRSAPLWSGPGPGPIRPTRPGGARRRHWPRSPSGRSPSRSAPLHLQAG